MAKTLNPNIYYVTCFGKPVCHEKGLPIHSDKQDDLLPLDWIVKKYPKLSRDGLAIVSTSKRKFFSTDWPK